MSWDKVRDVAFDAEGNVVLAGRGPDDAAVWSLDRSGGLRWATQPPDRLSGSSTGRC